MSYDFPGTPSEGQEFTPPVGGQTYVWRAPRWLVKGTTPGGGTGPTTGIDESPIDGKQYGRKDAAWTEVIPNPTWTTLSGKPETFPPDFHGHPQTEISGLVAALNAKEPSISAGTGSQYWSGNKTWQNLPAQDWNLLVNKPATFPPQTHGHVQSEIAGLVLDLSNKAALTHTHAQADVTGLATALSGKEPTIAGGTTAQYWRGDKTWVAFPTIDWSSLSGKPTTFPPSAHVHPITDVTDLQAALDTKALLAHTHETTDIINFDTILAGKASLTHTHAQADITGLVTALSGKSAVGHVHDYSTLTGIPSTFAPSAHVHTTAQITGLDAELAQKIEDPPSDGKEYVRKNGAWVVAALTPFQVNASGEAIIKYGTAVVVRITTAGLIMTENDIEVFSVSVG